MYHDKEWKQNDCDTEVAMKVKVLMKDDGDIIFKKMESIPKAACITVHGDYDMLGEAYVILGQWIEGNNYTICGNYRQISIKHPHNESNPNNYLTEIQIPIY